MNDRISRVRRLAAIAGGLTTGIAVARYALAGDGRPPLLFRLAARRALSDLDLPVGWILKSADRHYRQLVPKVAGAATAPGRANLRMSAYVLSIYRAMREEGVTERWAAELVGRGLFDVMRAVWRVPDAIVMRLAPRCDFRFA